jgi:hypothetical protein
VYGTAPDGTPDYHWYRQDYNGLWLHKRGTLDVESVDSDHMLIIDPEEAARDYSTSEYDYNANYYTFVGFFSITPWNNCFVSTDNPTYWSSGVGGLTWWGAYYRFIGFRYYCENEDDGIYPLDIKRSQLSLSQEENEKKSRFSLAFVRAAGRYNNKAIKRWLKKQCREITIRQ